MCFGKDANHDLFNEFYPNETEKYIKIERYFEHRGIRYHTDFMFEGKCFDYAFLFRQKVYLIDIYDKAEHFKSKSEWSLKNDIPYYVLNVNNYIEILDSIIQE